MYLLVFVTLVIALTGVYAQVLSLQAARLFSHQTTVARAMLTWHSTAVSQASQGVTTAAGPTGCDLTTNGPIGTLCANGGNNITVQVSTVVPPGGMQMCSGTVTASCWTALPPGYKIAPYTFYSILYQPAVGQNYVITFVPPPTITATNPAPGNVMLPTTGAAGAVQLGSTMADLMAQMKNTGLTPTSYGTIAAVAGINYLITSTISSGTTASYLQYALPTGFAIPLGSIAVISSL